MRMRLGDTSLDDISVSDKSLELEFKLGGYVSFMNIGRT